MKPRVTIARASSPDGTELELIEHDGDYVINADGLVLMSTRMVQSEVDLARLGCENLWEGARVLIGGLGCGYTLRAVLDLLPEGGRAVQAELVPEIVEWNRGPLARFANHPLDDERTDLLVDDVGAVIRRSPDTFDAILLDVDNGPSAIVSQTNSWMYTREGLQAIHRALKPHGRVAFWSADDARSFPDTLRKNGFIGSRHRVKSRSARKGTNHYIFMGKKK